MRNLVLNITSVSATIFYRVGILISKNHFQNKKTERVQEAVTYRYRAGIKLASACDQAGIDYFVVLYGCFDSHNVKGSEKVRAGSREREGNLNVGKPKA